VKLNVALSAFGKVDKNIGLKNIDTLNDLLEDFVVDAYLAHEPSTIGMFGKRPKIHINIDNVVKKQILEGKKQEVPVRILSKDSEHEFLFVMLLTPIGEYTDTEKAVINLLYSLGKNQKFKFSATTTVEGLKKSRVTKEPTPDKYKFVTKRSLMTVSIPNETYAEAVNKERQKNGLNNDFAAKQTYAEPLGTSGLLSKHKESGKVYLTFRLDHSELVSVQWLDAKGNTMSKEEIEYFNEHFGTKKDSGSGSKTQGLDSEDKIEFRRLSVENIDSIELVTEAA
jgi:hypothetical protein